MKKIVPAATLIILAFVVIGFKFVRHESPVVITDAAEINSIITGNKHVRLFQTPPLVIEGNKIKRKDTGEVVILKGAASDALRLSEGKYTDKSELLRRIGILKNSGGNLITLWITLDGYESSYDLAVEVVDFADKNGMYVLFAPAEPYSENWDERRNTLMIKVAEKFRDKTNIIYGLDAEPFQEWDVVLSKAKNLAWKLRSINPDAILFLPGSRAGRYIQQAGENKFPFGNTLFGTEDYLANTGSALEALLDKKGYTEKYAWQDPSYLNFPVLVSEMGGTSASDFGSSEDLAVISRMLKDIESRKFSYQMHSIDTYDKSFLDKSDISGLGLFDKFGSLTKKGILYFDHLSRYPGTKIQ